METEEAVEIDRALGGSRPGNGNARARGVIVALAEGDDHVEAVDRAALEDGDQDPASRRRGLDGPREKSGREAETQQGKSAVLHEDASGEHAHLL
jgi:hypothetical protein